MDSCYYLLGEIRDGYYSICYSLADSLWLASRGRLLDTIVTLGG